MCDTPCIASESVVNPLPMLIEVGMGHDAVYVRKDIADAAGIPGMSLRLQ